MPKFRKLLIAALIVSEDGDLAAPGLQAHSERILDGPEIFVGDTEERGEPGFGESYGLGGVRNRHPSLEG